MKTENPGVPEAMVQREAYRKKWPKYGFACMVLQDSGICKE
ncbi:MAG: hypothetical protein AAFQ20_04755 [Bacteroidota bacterium]